MWGISSIKLSHIYIVPQLIHNWVIPVVLFVIHLFDSTTRQCLVTVETWIMCHVRHTIIDGGTPFRRIRDCVNLRVNRTLFVSIPHDGFVVGTCEEPIVAHTDEPIVLHEDTPHLQPLTRRPNRGEICDVYKVFIPCNAIGHIEPK